MDYQEFLQFAESDIELSSGDDASRVIDTYLRGYQRCNSGSGTLQDSVLGVSIAQVRRDLELRLESEPAITTEDIERLRDYHGARALSDLGADYDMEFFQWFSGEYAEIFDEWLEQDCECADEGDTKIAEELLFNFTNNTLGMRVYDTYNEILARFCEACLKARRHIREVIQRLDSRE